MNASGKANRPFFLFETRGPSPPALDHRHLSFPPLRSVYVGDSCGKMWALGDSKERAPSNGGPSGREVSAGVSTSGLPLHLLQQIGDGLPGRINLIWAAAAGGKGQKYGRKAN